jgi:hypothetical protein
LETLADRLDTHGRKWIAQFLNMMPHNLDEVVEVERLPASKFWQSRADSVMMIVYGDWPTRCGGVNKAGGAMRKQIALGIVLALGAGTVALAETAEEQQACTNDAFQFCQNFIPDRSRVFNCLASNKDRISAACHTAMAPYLPAEPVVALKKQPAPHEQSAKSKGPLNLAPH